MSALSRKFNIGRLRRSDEMRLRRSDGIRPGFSLLELLAVVTLIGIIASLLVPRIQASSDSAKEKSCDHNRAELNSAIERFGITNGNFPSSLNDLNVLDYFPGGIPTCPVTENAYTINATTNRIDGHTNSGNH